MPKRFDNYEVLGEVGRGGMGVVFRGRSSVGLDVAIKLLARQGKLPLDRFRREERLLLEFTEDEGFVPIIDVGETNEGPFFVMPFHGGGTLRARIEAGPLAIADVVALARSVARAIGIAHARGIVHRDLKPENVIFTLDGRPLVADLGLAKHFRNDLDGGLGGGTSLSLSMPGTLLGTAGYMSSEQLQDAKRAGPPADVFALGVVIYECLTSRQPFEGDSIIEQIARVETGTFPSLREARPEVPVWLEQVVTRALAHAPEARYRDGGELDQALGNGPTAAAFRNAVTTVGVTLVESPRPAVPAPSIASADLASTRRWRLLGFGACGVLALGCLGSAGALVGLLWFCDFTAHGEIGYRVAMAAAHASPSLREHLGGEFHETAWITSTTYGTSPEGAPTFAFEVSVQGTNASGVLACETCDRKNGVEVVSETFLDDVTGKRFDVAPVGSQGR